MLPLKYICAQYVYSNYLVLLSFLGAFILAYSYKDSLQITVAANSNILTENETNYLVQLLNHEFAQLTNGKIPLPAKRGF